MSTDITVDDQVDARDLMCPMPVLATAKAIRLLEPGQVLKVLATDRGSLSDIPAWVEDTGNELVATDTDGDVLVFYIRRSAAG